jgi:nicotinate-nucleotide adenylyltransferase
VGVTDSPPRIGLFGGAFDPPHVAHVALVRAAIEQLDLGQLHVLPTGDAWHKSRTLSAPGHRLAMARLAFGDIPRVVVDDRELRRTGPTYTVDTLRELQAEHPGAQPVLVIGADQAGSLPAWRDWEYILANAIISVATREAATWTNSTFDLKSVPGARLAPLALPAMPVSATQIRGVIAAGQRATKGLEQLVPGPVARYIDHHHLYQTA